MKVQETLQYLEDRWDNQIAGKLSDAELLRYRSNLLGSDLRITNFGGGNTSSKIAEPDPLDGNEATVLWIKGSGGDVGSITSSGFATLYLDKVLALANRYRGVANEDEMVELYPLCTFGKNAVAASIDTPLHAFLPFAHVDHLHPDWGIALAAAANGKAKMEEYNRRFDHRLVWIPWQRPGFELAMMLRAAVNKNPGCDGIVLGGHGLFTWGQSQRECYMNTLTIIDQLGQFVQEHVEQKGNSLFGGARHRTLDNHRELALDLFPFLRGKVSSQQRMIGSFSDRHEVLNFVNSSDAESFAHLGTSCPDHFIRTKIRPLFVPWTPTRDLRGLRDQIDSALAKYREEYKEYYRGLAREDSPTMRSSDPTVVLIPAIGMFSFGKNKTEARITGEFYTNAIHVMEGATALGDGRQIDHLPQAGPTARTEAFCTYSNYVALPAAEAFGIEYWQLEEAKIRRQPPEKELSRRVALIVGGASGIGRAAAELAVQQGAHVVVADRDENGAVETAEIAQKRSGKESVIATGIDIGDRKAVWRGIRATV